MPRAGERIIWSYCADSNCDDTLTLTLENDNLAKDLGGSVATLFG